ncbi:transposase [Zooshikella ganghwensis]|uniref:Transposase n=2 Tax=Zooshikella ganghwensis TaxID=202772 RepID=A0A4P9VQ12_9GAMM|nr:transposase [Zooshikella ganghwensis]
MGIAVTGVFCWAAFERCSLGAFKQDQLRWMFYHGKMAWSSLLQASVRVILNHYRLSSGVLIFDDSDKLRSKNTRRIKGVHKIRHKKTGGYAQGQELVFMLLVTPVVTLPIDFRFYVPDPALSAWRKKNKALKRLGIPGKERPKKPKLNPDYPTKQALAREMVEAFSLSFSEIKINAVIADALYSTAEFMDKVSLATGGAQVVSQLRSNQTIISRGKKVRLTHYFARQAGVNTELIIRGQQSKSITMLAARVYVKAHGKKRFVVALKYEGEKNYRYLVASDMSWRQSDIARVYTLRWLVEVFIEDWKQHAGWNRLAKQQGEEGSTRGVIMSLLYDHMLLLHPEQSVRLEKKQPGLPVGCLTERIKTEALIKTVEAVVKADEPKRQLEAFTTAMISVLPERQSKKHLAGLDLGKQEPTNSLKYRAAA